DLRREEPAKVAGATGRHVLDVDAADRALLELDRMARSNQARGELADIRLVADQRDARLARVLFQVGDQRGVAGARRERLDVDERRTRRQPAGDDFGRLARANERAGEHDVERDAEARQAACGLAHARHALFGQRTLLVVGPRVTAFLREAVADQIK